MRSRLPHTCAAERPEYGWQRLLATLDVQPIIGAAAARSACLLYGITVVYRSRPEESDQGEANAPGDGEDGTVSDRRA